MKTKKINFNSILKYFALLFLFLCLANANINNISPFIYALFFACLYVGLDEKLTAIFALSSAVIVDFSLQTFFVAISSIAVGLIAFYLHKLFKRKLKLIPTFILFILSLITYFYYNFFDFKIVYFLLLGIISLYIFIVVAQVLLLRNNCFKLTLDETICFLFSFALLGLGLANVTICNLAIYRFILMLAIFILISINNPMLTFSLTLAFAFGVGIGKMSLLPLAEFALVALMAGIFPMPHKFKICFSVILSDILIQYLFFAKNIILLYDLLPILLASIIFLILPNRVLNNLSDVVYVKKSEMSSRNLINTTRKSIRRRLSELSNVFLDMKQLHLNMVKKDLTKEETIAMLSREILNNCCKDCLDKNKCTRSLGLDNKSNLELMIEIALTKGKVSLLDIPSSLINRCGKVNNLVSLTNRLVDEYRQYKSMVADVNNVKILLADQMGAVSNLLLNIGDEINSNVSFDMARENKIISRLLSLNVECKEVLLYSEKNNDLSAVIITKADETFNPIIEKVLTEVIKSPMRITNITPLEDGGYNSITLHKKNKFDCVFGLAGCNKTGNEVCGDCHSIIRLSGNRFLLALCDGMGAGKSAHDMSAMTLGLIENFYKVGFDNDIILESVNKLLSVSNQENYSTLDVCLVDLDKEIVDFIKVGSPFGIIKRDTSIDLIEGGALPIGALDSITPVTHKTTISTKDMIIMFTDGITDAFQTQDNLIEYISKLVSTNPQTIAESILNEALHLNGMFAKDDMTVLVARTYLKN